jgi:hypothetical protein
MNDENTIFEAGLTPAAREVLNEILVEFRGELVARAFRHASERFGEPREIGVNDLLAALGEVRGAGQTTRRQTRLERLLLVYAVAGTVVAMFGVLFAVYDQVFTSLSAPASVSLLAATVAAVLAAVSFLLLTRLRLRAYSIEAEGREFDARDPGAVGTFLAAWIELERVIDLLAEQWFGESATREPFVRIVELLAKAVYLSPEDHQRLRELARVRNNVVHGAGDYSALQLLNAAEQAQALTNRLRARVMEQQKGAR